MLKIIFYLFTYKISNNYYKYIRLYNLKDKNNNIYNNINNDINNIFNSTNSANIENITNSANIENITNSANSINIENSANSINIENIENIENSENSENIENSINIENIENITNIENSENSENIENSANIENSENITNSENNISSYDKNSLFTKKDSLIKEFYKNLYNGIDQSKEKLNYNPSNNTHYISSLDNNELSEYNLTKEIIFRNNVNLYKKNILDKLRSNISIINKLNHIEEYNEYFDDSILGCNIKGGNLMEDWNFDF